MTAEELPIFIIVWVVCGIASLLIAQSKGVANPGGWFVTGLLLGPLGVLFALLNARPDPVPATPTPPPMPSPAGAGFCAHCGAARVVGARFCASCGRQFEA